NHERCRPFAAARRMFFADNIETMHGALDVAVNELGVPRFDLNVYAASRSDSFDVLIRLHANRRCSRCSAAKKTGGRIEVLVEEAAMNGLNPFELPSIKHS